MEVREASANYLRTTGYKQTEVGMIPKDWDVVNLGRTCTQVTTGKLDANAMKENGEYRFYTCAKDYYQIDTYAFDTEALLVSGNGANVGYIHYYKGKFNAYQRTYVLSGFLESIKYLQHYMGQKLADRLRVEVNAGNTPYITRGTLTEMKVALPPTKAEQEAIAEALSDADALIESLSLLLAKKRHLKQGAMQQLLTGKKRLPGFSGEWEVKRLGELGSTFGGLTGKTKNDFGHGTARYITFMNIMTNVVIDCATFEFVDVRPAESQNRAAKGDLFFNGSSETPEEVGMCAVLMQEVQGVFLNSFCFGFRFRDGAPADGLYLAYYFRSREGRELLKSLAQGATRYNLSKTALLKISFPLPNLPEQTAIATILSGMDAEIAALEAKLAKARNLKQGMMQELLTGRIRLLSVPDKEAL